MVEVDYRVVSDNTLFQEIVRFRDWVLSTLSQTTDVRQALSDDGLTFPIQKK